MSFETSRNALWSSYEDLRRQLGILVALDVSLALAWIGYSFLVLDPLVIPFVIGGSLLSIPYWIALVYLDRGRNWARRYVALASALGLLSVALALAGNHGPVLIALEAASGVVCLYQLIVLNTRRAKQYFQPAKPPAPGARGRLSRRLKLTLGIGGGLLWLIVVWFSMVGWFLWAAGRTDIWVEDLDSGRIQRISRDGSNDWPEFSPDGRQIAYVHSSGLFSLENWEVRIHSLDGGGMKAALSIPAGSSGPTWDPSGQHVAYCAPDDDGASDIWLWSPALDSKELLCTVNDKVSQCRWSPDGRSIGVQGGYAEASWILLIAADCESLLTHMPGRRQAGPFDWSPSGSQVAYLRGKDALVIRNLDNGSERELRLRTLTNRGVTSRPYGSPPIFLPWDSTKVLVSYTGARGQLALVSLATGGVAPWKSGRRLLEKNHDLSPVGKVIAFARPGGGGE